MQKMKKLYIVLVSSLVVLLGFMVWKFEPLTLLRTMIFTGASHDVIINEIMWMGTDGTGGGGDTDDMFLELRNMTTTVIDFSTNPFVIEKDTGSGFATMVTINSGTLPSEGYFIISNLSAGTSRLASSDFVDTGLSLEGSSVTYRLRDDSYNLLDEVDDGSGVVLAGSFTSGSVYKSMERNSDVGDGADGGSWHNASGSSGFDSSSPEYGTPGEENSPVTPVLTGYTASSDPVFNSGLGGLNIQFDVSGNQNLAGLTFEVEERVSGGAFLNIDGDITLDDSLFPILTFVRTNLDDLTHYEYRIRAKNIDNITSDYSTIHGVDTLDRTAPTFVTVHSGYLESSLDVHLQVDTDEVTTITYQIDVAPGDCVNPLMNSYAEPDMIINYPYEGVHHLYLCSQDAEGNYSSLVDNVVIIDIPPLITVSFPVDGSYINRSSFLLEANIYENLNLSSATYGIDVPDGELLYDCRDPFWTTTLDLGNAFTTSGSVPNFTTSDAITGLGDGVHTLFACAGGAPVYNQVSDLTSLTFIVDTVSPFLANLVYPVTALNGSLDISFDVGDVLSGVNLDTLEVEMNGSIYTQSNSPGIVCMSPPVAHAYSCSLHVTLSTNGSYPFTIRTEDMATNHYEEVHSILLNMPTTAGGSGGGGGGSANRNPGDNLKPIQKGISLETTPSGGVVVSKDPIYRDIPTRSPYFDAVQNLTARAVITGHEDNTFRAYENLTRAEACVVMVRAKKLSIKPISEYSQSIRGLYDDVDSHPLASYILAATEAQLVHGRQELSNPLPVVHFDPDAPVSKAELGKMAVETILPELAHSPVTTSVPSDIDSTGFWWVKDYYYGALVKIKAFDPKNVQFVPESYVQRGQLADYFWKAIQEDELK